RSGIRSAVQRPTPIRFLATPSAPDGRWICNLSDRRQPNQQPKVLSSHLEALNLTAPSPPSKEERELARFEISASEIPYGTGVARKNSVDGRSASRGSKRRRVPELSRNSNSRPGVQLVRVTLRSSVN